jgi:probable HAF family extracellular repeat protein
VESQPPGIACPGTCSADFPAGQITLTETPAQGSALAYWAGACGGSSATCSVRLGASVAGTQEFLVVADFEPPPPLTYSVREIPKSYTAYTLNAAGNATGVGYGGTHSGDGDAFLFDAATGKTSFLFFSTPESSHAQGINGRNAIVANAITSRTGDTRTRTVRWEAGVATDLGTIGGNTWGYGINDSNQVVGWFVKTDGPRSYTRAFFHDGQRMLDLGSLDGTCSEARSINASGVAVGSSCVGNTQHAVIFHRGAAPEDLTPDSPGIADVVSDAGYIAGRSGADGFIRSPGGQLRSAGRLPGGSGSWLHGVNDSGVAVGVAYVPAYNAKRFLDTAFRAVVFVDGRLWDLGYLTGSPDLLLLEAFGVNASGQIVARGFRPGADGSSFLLTPR